VQSSVDGMLNDLAVALIDKFKKDDKVGDDEV
jgi:hypothetical protein